MAKTGRKQKKERNKMLVQKKNEDPENISFRDLADMFNITRGRACQLYHKYKDQYEQE